MQAVAQSSDRAAFAHLFKHFAPRVKALLIRSGSPVDVADELVQEAMVTVWRKAPSFDPSKATLATWIFAIARNLRIDHLRRKSARIQTTVDDEWSADDHTAEDAVSPEDLVFAGERERLVRRALDTLPAEQSLLIRMSFFEDHAHSAIAQRLGMPLGTVKSRIRLAVASLRRIIDGFET